jgi:PAS domain S-box-containing protein
MPTVRFWAHYIEQRWPMHQQHLRSAWRNEDSAFIWNSVVVYQGRSAGVDRDEFARQIETARWRVAGLERHAGEVHTHSEEWLPNVFEELHVAFEELRVAEEELLQQNNELMTTRERVEVERQRYQDLFEFAPDAYLMTTTNGTIREANRAAAALFGIPQRSLVGMSLSLFVVDYARRAFRHDVSRLRHVDGPQEWEVRLQPHHGASFEAAITVVAIRDWSGMPAGLRWMVRDITARKQAEEQIRVLNTQLEQRVRERTTQLEATNAAKDDALAREQAARAIAEQAVREREAFMAIAAHELKAPLSAIVGYAQLLQRRIMHGDTLKSRDLRGLRTIGDQGQRLINMVDLLLDSSRIEAGQLTIERVPLDLCTLVRRVTETVRGTLKQRPLELHCPDMPMIVAGDTPRLEQVVQNLLQNAITYSPAGGPVTVLLEQVDDQVRLMVSDQGIGIPEAAREQIFERFYRADNVDPEHINGMGIGLYIVKDVVAQHGGWIEVASKVGVGSTFTIWLPLAQDT